MIKNHITCKPPTDQEIKVWRYYDLSKFADLVLTKSLYFARADKFKDVFEGSLSKPSIHERKKQLISISSNKKWEESNTEFWNNIGLDFKKKYAISCWHMNNYESAAMWRIFLKTDEGIAIQSTYQKLENCLDKVPKPVYVGVVNYIDYDNDLMDWGNKMVPFLHKRKSFSHEQEIRAILRSTDYDLKDGGFKLVIDINLLIEKIFVSPNSPEWFTLLIKELVKDYSFNVVNSKLDDKPIY